MTITAVKYRRPDGTIVTERVMRDGSVRTKIQAPRGGWVDLASLPQFPHTHRTTQGPAPLPTNLWQQGCGDAVAELVRRMRRLCQRRIITIEDRRFGQPHYGH